MQNGSHKNNMDDQKLKPKCRVCSLTSNCRVPHRASLYMILYALGFRWVEIKRSFEILGQWVYYLLKLVFGSEKQGIAQLGYIL